MIRYATFGRRTWGFLLAFAIDLLVLSVLQVLIGGNEALAPFACWYLIHHVALVTEGGNLGHRLAGLRVVRADGERVRVLNALFRQVSLLFISIPPLGMGLLWMLDEPSGRTWHDIIGGTVVVRETAAPEHGAPGWAEDPPWRSQAAPVPSEALAMPVPNAEVGSTSDAP